MYVVITTGVVCGHSWPWSQWPLRWYTIQTLGGVLYTVHQCGGYRFNLWRTQSLQEPQCVATH